MTPERWGQMEELYQAARALAPSQRAALLERADPELRATVESLLAQEEDGAFLDHPAWEGRESLLKHDGPLQAETPVSVGEHLGPYRIEQKIGKGGMGEVWKARDMRLGRSVAIKTSAARFSDRFEREARAISALNHPNICTLYDIGPDYLVMELVEGSSPKGPLPLDEALRIAGQDRKSTRLNSSHLGI